MRTAIITLIAAPVLLAPPARADAPQWRVTEISGPVSVGQAGKARTVARGGLLNAGDLVATGAGGRAVLTRGEEYVIVSPGSRLRLPEAAAGSGVMQWIEDFGTAVFRIQKKALPHFGVQTPYLAAVVKGTTFSVTVGATGASVQVVEGAVQVATADGGASELIRPGMIANVAANDRFRLTVDGDTRRTITSPNAPQGAGGPAPVPVAAATGARIEVAVQDVPPALEALTGGLVSADIAGAIAASTASAGVAHASERSIPAHAGASPPIATPPLAGGVLPPPSPPIVSLPDPGAPAAPVVTNPVVTAPPGGGAVVITPATGVGVPPAVTSPTLPTLGDLLAALLEAARQRHGDDDDHGHHHHSGSGG